MIGFLDVFLTMLELFNATLSQTAVVLDQYLQLNIAPHFLNLILKSSPGSGERQCFKRRFETGETVSNEKYTRLGCQEQAVSSRLVSLSTSGYIIGELDTQH